MCYLKIKFWVKLLTCSLLLLLFTLGCSQRSTRKTITVAGSTSIQPFADKWAEVYMKKQPGWTVNVQGGGSSSGIQAAFSGAANIGMSSRELKTEEKQLKEIVIARDGLAIIIHPTNPVQNLKLEQIRDIFKGTLRSWKGIGGPAEEINVVTREEGSGTRGAFQEMVMKKERIYKGAIVQDSNGAVREIVAGDPNAIGYISLGLVNEQVKAISLNGVKPTEQNILNHTYKLVRPFLFVCNGQPTEPCQLFIDFVLSAEGQKLAQEEGLIPVHNPGEKQ